jgi:hypothetical protein
MTGWPVKFFVHSLRLRASGWCIWVIVVSLKLTRVCNERNLILQVMKQVVGCFITSVHTLQTRIWVMTLNFKINTRSTIFCCLHLTTIWGKSCRDWISSYTKLDGVQTGPINWSGRLACTRMQHMQKFWHDKTLHCHDREMWWANQISIFIISLM